MLARLQRWMVLAASLATLSTVGLLAANDRWLLAALAAITALTGHAWVLVAEFALMHRTNRGDSAIRATGRELMTAWWGEAIHAPRVFCWRQPFRSEAWPDELQTAAPGYRGVLLVHGFICNRGLWNRWVPELRARGIPHVAVNLEPVFGSIDEYVTLINAAIERLEAATGRPPVVVAHSMGGLAVRRWWVDTSPGRIRRLITIGTPHHGTWLARWGRSPNGIQMRVASPWRERLAQHEGSAHASRMTCFYGHCDNIVFPASTAMYAGADNRHLRAVAHVHMVDHPDPLAEALRWARGD